jgi:N-6 DNA Methylase
MVASLKPTGRMAVVLDTGAVSRGSGNTGSIKERDIRKSFVEDDLSEAVLLLPENLFYNTPAPGIVMVLNLRKRYPGDILLIDIAEMTQGKVLASSHFTQSGFPVYGANGQIGFFNEYTHEHSEVLVTCRGATCGTVNLSRPKSFITNNALAVEGRGGHTAGVGTVTVGMGG